MHYESAFMPPPKGIGLTYATGSASIYCFRWNLPIGFTMWTHIWNCYT